MSSNLSRQVYQKTVRELTGFFWRVGQTSLETRQPEAVLQVPLQSQSRSESMVAPLVPELLAPLTILTGGGPQKLLPKPLLSLELEFALPITPKWVPLSLTSLHCWLLIQSLEWVVWLIGPSSCANNWTSQETRMGVFVFIYLLDVSSGSWNVGWPWRITDAITVPWNTGINILVLLHWEKVLGH